MLVSGTLLSLFQSPPPTIKTSDFTPVLTAFYDAAVSGSPTASIVKAQRTNRAKRRQKTKNKKLTMVLFHSGLVSHAEGSPTRSREHFVHLGRGAQGSELKARESPP